MKGNRARAHLRALARELQAAGLCFLEDCGDGSFKVSPPREGLGLVPQREAPAPPSNEACRWSRYMHEALVVLYPNARRRDTRLLMTWARSLDQFQRIDQVPWEKIGDALEWLFTENPKREYPFDVRSPGSLRVKWDKIQATMEREGWVPPGKSMSAQEIASTIDAMEKGHSHAGRD